MNVQEIKQLQDKNYVKGSVRGTITSTRNVEGKNMSMGKFGDDSGTIDLTSFGQDIRRFDGKEVVLSGMGIRKDSYNGYDKLQINDKTKIVAVAEDAPATPSAPTPAQAPKATLSNLADDYGAKLVMGYKVADSVEADLDGRVPFTGEDRRSIAISFVIEANRKGL